MIQTAFLYLYLINTAIGVTNRFTFHTEEISCLVTYPHLRYLSNIPNCFSSRNVLFAIFIQTDISSPK